MKNLKMSTPLICIILLTLDGGIVLYKMLVGWEFSIKEFISYLILNLAMFHIIKFLLQIFQNLNKAGKEQDSDLVS